MPSMLTKYRTIFAIVIVAAIAITAAVAIFWARGFKPDITNRRIERTGLIVANSIPTGANVYLDDRFTSATDTTITYLEPKTYKVRIQKDGYTTWEKEIEVRADLATEIKALLFPTAGEIKPLTTTGATNPTLSPDGTKIIYATGGERGGLYSLPMSDRPFPFRQDAALLVRNSPSFNYTQATFTWSPDSSQIIAHFMSPEGQSTANLLIDVDRDQQEPRDITAALSATLANWQEELNASAQTKAIIIPQEIKDATAAAEPENLKLLFERKRDQIENLKLNFFPTGLIFSPDEEKVLFKNKQNQYKVYDLKTKKEFTLPQFPDLVNLMWYPDSNHLVAAQKDLISIMETDGTNKMTVYSGKFENGFVFAHPSGTRLIILTTLTQPEGNPANLYSINLR